MKKGVILSFMTFMLSFMIIGFSSKSYGAEINSVSELQQRLQDMGYNIGAVDGIYGKRTDAAVRAFQADSGLRADGIVGPATISALGATYLQTVSRTAAARLTEAATNTMSDTAYNANAGLSSDNIMELQRLLQLAGYNVGVSDGIYGARTAAAVRAFQANMGLRADGIVGRATMAALGMGTDNSYTQQRAAGTAAATLTERQENTPSYNTADIQRLLLDAGYSTGSIDGVFGTRTESAIRAFQANHGLIVDGIVGPATLKTLLLY